MSGPQTPVALVAGASHAVISPRGAEVLAWRVGETPMLWTPDPAVWPDVAPLLFPVVGWTRHGVRHRGKAYDLGLHGFARASQFAVDQQASDRVRMTLVDTAATRAVYPFAFRFTVEHVLRPGSLETRLTVANPGAAPLAYAVGLHPGFRWPPGAGAAPSITFAKQERAETPVIAAGGLFSPQWRPTPLVDGRRLPLTAEAFAQEALCFLNIASRRFVYDNGAGARVTVTLDDFPHVAFWARPPAPFICLEAWTGYGDPVGFAGEIFDKPSMRILPPGAQAHHGARFDLDATARV